MTLSDEISLHKFLGQIASDMYQFNSPNESVTIRNGYPEGISPDINGRASISDDLVVQVGRAARWGPYPQDPSEEARWGNFVWA